MEIITPADYVGSLMELAQQRRGEFVDMQYLTEARTTLVYQLPLAEVTYHTPHRASGAFCTQSVVVLLTGQTGCAPLGVPHNHSKSPGSERRTLASLQLGCTQLEIYETS